MGRRVFQNVGHDPALVLRIMKVAKDKTSGL